MVISLWNAEGFREVTASGRTQPLILSCRPAARPEAPAKDFVVKAIGLPEIYEAKLYAEAFGNALARLVHVATPTPALVDIPEALVPLLGKSLANASRNAHPRAGLAAGCEWLGPGMSPPTTFTNLKATEVEDAAFIYAFDMAVQNPDRLVKNPNCLADGARYYAIDFETCFSFSLNLPFLKAPPAWKVTEHGLYPSQDHLFWLTLRDARVDWAPVEAAFRDLTEDRLLALTSSIPTDWKSHEVRIFTHLLELAANSTAFIDELRRSLS